MTRKLVLLGLSTVALLAGCASAPPVQQPVPVVPPKTTTGPAPLSPRMAKEAEYLTRMAAEQDRLYQVAAPLLIQNAELCKAHARNLLGFTAKNRFSYPGDYNEAAHLAFGMGDQLQVTGVLAGSGAAHAGLKRGDGLLAAEGKQLPSGPNASTLAGAVLGPLVSGKATIRMTVERKGATREVQVPVTRACAFGIELGNADNVNSYADGSRVLVTRGMIGFTQSNDELAYVLASGMAHNLLGHPASLRLTNTLGSMIDNLVSVRPDTSLLIGSGGIKSTPADMDAAADELAVYMVARAGYDIDHMDDFWQRFAAAHPATEMNGYTANHPATSARIAAITKAQAEVRAKRAAKQPLVP
jgi:hypothetical protein